MSEPATVTYDVIGVVRSPFRSVEATPLQPVAGQAALGSIELDPRHLDALEGLDGFLHIWVVTHLHAPPGAGSHPPDPERGVLATRSPNHPNPMGISVVELVEIAGTSIRVAGLDLLDGTPVLDLRPYVPLFDSVDAEPAAPSGRGGPTSRA